jgi:cation diffusion facilitator family transporter
MEQTDRQKKSLRAVNIGLGANFVLAGMKSVVGVIGHSPALLADGINSTSDVVYFIIVRIYMKLADKPADREHPYGHKQLEHISSLVVGAFVMTTAVAIFWDAVNRVYELLSGQAEARSASWLALGVAVFTILSKIILFLFTRKTGQKTGNTTVTAIAYDHRNDIFSASAAAVGIALSRFGFAWVDPLAGAFVAMIILRTGIKILRDSADELMNTVPDQEAQKRIHGLVCSVKGVQGMEELHMHRYGPYMMITLTINVDGALKVSEGDLIAGQVEKLLHEEFSYIRRVNIHYHPVHAPAPVGCLPGV